ncbi:MAG: T9SS type A sorting domain-containing protein [Bacteroidales bacterium]|nr:T9SS type A sorting domain-containing protein [Bacteroidales bacterium]
MGLYGELRDDFQESLMVYDMHGKLLQSLPVKDSRMQVNLSGYPSGIYLIKVGSSIGKVIKK